MKVKLHIEGMSCENCTNHVSKAVEELPGIQTVKVNLKKQEAKVKFDETLIDEVTIIKKINEDTVYQASSNH